MRNSERIHSIRYKRLGIPGVCYYCGVQSAAEDHVPPLALVSDDPDLRVGLPFWLVPVCTECNSHLGCLPLLMLEGRRAHILKAYRSKYRRILSIPAWEPEELAGLKYNLRHKVVTGLALKRAILERMAVLGRKRSEPAPWLDHNGEPLDPGDERDR